MELKDLLSQDAVAVAVVPEQQKTPPANLIAKVASAIFSPLKEIMTLRSRKRPNEIQDESSSSDEAPRSRAQRPNKKKKKQDDLDESYKPSDEEDVADDVEEMTDDDEVESEGDDKAKDNKDPDEEILDEDDAEDIPDKDDDGEKPDGKQKSVTTATGGKFFHLFNLYVACIYQLVFL